MSRDDALHTLDLADGWQVAEFADGPATEGRRPGINPQAGWFAAEVPGAVQYDLMRIGRLASPYASSEAVQAAEWVHQTDWLFRRTFDFDAAAVGDGELFLEVDGIDTFADVWLNDVLLGTTANAYRAYRFPIDASTVKAGKNELLVHIKAHKRMVADMVPEAERRLGPSFKYKGLIRRYQRSFFAGSSLLNLGGEVLGIGIYKPMRIVVLPQLRIEDVYFETTSISERRAAATVAVALNAAPAAGTSLSARLVDPDSDAEIAQATVAAGGTVARLELTVDNPRLWWPRGYGAPHRYRLEVELAAGGQVRSRDARMVGLRTSTIRRKEENGRPTFQLVINGVPIHARGHNIVPIDYIKVHGPKAAYQRLMRIICDGNSNIIRIWGGGAIESADFFDMCDGEGIMIWQDFYLHSTTYPDYDERWVAEYRTECEELLRRLRSRPSFVVICGGNEQCEGWDEWGWRGQLDRFYGETLFTEVGREVAGSLTPTLPYVLNSPHGGASCQAPATGDVHNWGNFYNSTKDPLFVTETCWSQESYSRAETLEAVMGLDFDAYAEIGWPEKWSALTGRGLVTRLPYSGGPLVVDSLRTYLKCLEIEQAMADHHALANLLMHGPSCNGLIYWPLNKGGPLFQFGCVDYSGYPLASYYIVKRLFADVVVTIYRDIEDIRVVAVNRRQSAVAGTLHLSHQSADGTIIKSWQEPVSIAASGRARLANLAGYYREVIDRNAEVMKAALVVDGESASEETLFFTPLMEFAVKPRTLSASVSRIGKDTWQLDVAADSVVKLFYAEGNQKYLMSDNYFALSPESPRTIIVTLLERMNAEPAVLRLYAMDSAETHEFALE